jgi:predicted lipoprotein
MAGRTKSEHRGKRKAMSFLVGAGIVGCTCYFLPPFKIVSLDQARAKRAQEAFQPKKFAETFWTNELRKALGNATLADDLLPLIRSDPAAAEGRFGRTAELGNTYYYFVRGTGRVTEVGHEEVTVVLASSARSSGASVVLLTANVFGNAIRNGTGLLDVNSFANSQDFNNVSHELNLIAESKVLAPFREVVSVGTQVKFVGCTEIADEDRDLDPLRIVPVYLEVQDAPDSGGSD